MTFPNLRRHLWLQKKWILASAALLITQAGLVVLAPLPLKAIIDGVFGQKPSAIVDFLSGRMAYSPQEMLIALVGLVGLIALIMAALDFLEEYVLNSASHRVMESIRKDLTGLLLTRQMSVLERRRKIDFLGRLSGDVENLDVLIISGLGVFVRALPMLAMVLISMFVTDWRFSALVFVAIPVMVWLGYYFSSRLKNEMRRLRYAVNDFEQDTTQSLEAVQLIKSFSIEPAIRESLFKRITAIRVLTLISRISQGGLVSSLTIVRSIVRIGVLLIGGFGILRGDFTLGSLVVFLAYTDSLSKPVNELSKFSSKWAKAVTSVKRFEELYDDFQGTAEIGGHRRISTGAWLSFDSISYSHQDGPRLLDDYSARFSGGEVVGLVGPSGTGKSSFIKMLNRLADPTHGEISLGGINLREYDLDFLRHMVTIVYQEPYFTYDTIRANLSLIRPGHLFSDNELFAALAKVNADAFVRELPNGLDTLIGEGARRLSGGQMQRLSLARAFLRQPSLVYVFDEATSGLDPHSARVVFGSVRKLTAGGALVFWVTHRPEELQHCDHIERFRFDGNPTRDGVEEKLVLA